MFAKHCRLLPGIAFAALLIPNLARADKIVLPNGQTRQGIVSKDPNNPNLIIFRDQTGTLRLPRDKVKEVITEEPYKGHLAIGNAFLQTGDGVKAAESFKQAEALGAPKAEIQEAYGKARLLNQETAIREKAKTMSELEELLVKAQDAQEAQKFDDAQKALEKAQTLNPTAEQKAIIQSRLISLHLAWGKERLDRVDYTNAARHFTIVRQMDPENETAMRYLVENIKKEPKQWKEVAKYYENELKRNPDNVAQHRDLADVYYEHGEYDSALPHYIAVFDAGKAGAYGAETRIAKTFQNVVKRLEEESDYAHALEAQKQYQARYPQTDPKVAPNLEYAMRREKILADTQSSTASVRLDKLAELALWCHSVGLEDKAEKELAYVLQIQPAHVLANQLLGQYARQSLDRAQARLDVRDYVEARRQARQTIDKYPNQREVVELAAELIEKCTTEIDRVVETKRGEAMEWARKGDQDWASAQTYVDNLRSNQVNASKTQINDYTLAIQFIDRSVDAWKEARRIDPSLASPTKMNLTEKIKDAENLKTTLSSRDYRSSNLRPRGSSNSNRNVPVMPIVPPGYYDWPTTGPLYRGPVGPYPPTVPPTNPWWRRITPF
ncbi:MAG: tetratricopeptide repeat protein [Candidatus Sumerlaeota bacterium]|nr:tetratricopeptide repeat protein [Candidatus Sumerlaeota bacterium]